MRNIFMSENIEELTNTGGTNNLLEFISTYFPFIEDPLKLTYRNRTYKVLTTGIREFEFEDFFISFECRKCNNECCKNMYIPFGFEQSWPQQKLKKFRGAGHITLLGTPIQILVNMILLKNSFKK
jgi:hypothetical protein